MDNSVLKLTIDHNMITYCIIHLQYNCVSISKENIKTTLNNYLKQFGINFPIVIENNYKSLVSFKHVLEDSNAKARTLFPELFKDLEPPSVTFILNF